MERNEERKAIGTGRENQEKPSSFSSLQSICYNTPESQATVPDGSRVSDARGLLACLHVTSPSRTAKIKEVMASRTTRKTNTEAY